MPRLHSWIALCVLIFKASFMHRLCRQCGCSQICTQARIHFHASRGASRFKATAGFRDTAMKPSPRTPTCLFQDGISAIPSWPSRILGLLEHKARHEKLFILPLLSNLPFLLLSFEITVLAFIGSFIFYDTVLRLYAATFSLWWKWLR